MYKRKLEELLQGKEVRGLNLTLVTGEDIYIEKVDDKSDENILVVEELNDTLINLNKVVKVTKVVDEDFVMHDVNF
ncbi:hypothetical protein [Staphylococcus chromogenes]|uniref:hypothetical protein n=1 Tax=Staphylococcus chromogenes TaxID=46126 RepID=UPI000E692CFD|nr:hypothetical protein [Staphylococcus chromogenes]RIM04466.1 hypothetical protein BU683_05145 [Staphylococcus chromogenes]RIM21382.1 hypothetical protein BU660_03595 [Staphylococcus chromogenes]